MKKTIHPPYFPEATVNCSCGHVFKVGSTKEMTEVEICSHCHPFYTGKEKSMDRVGQVQKFRERVAKKTKSPERSRGTEKKKKGN